jgi:PAS domain S-box-containing protein
MRIDEESNKQLAPQKPQIYPIRTKPYVCALGIIWTLVVSASLIWNVRQTQQEILDVARYQARVAYDKDVIYRRWNAMHGGVYVPITDKTPPNPYLEGSERDVITPIGMVLTKMNPAYMTRQIHEMAAEAYGVRGHVTSLNPIRPANSPDSWESEALQAFQGGAEEISSVEEIQGQPYLRLMRPLFTENACLTCHAIQGYRLGDIRGGISVSLPMKALWAMEHSQIFTLLLGHALLWLLGLVGLGLGARRLAEQITERQHAEESLRQNRNRLERINECLLELGPDHNANINRLTSLCGELLGGACALYNHADEGMLCSKGQWQTPPDFKGQDIPEGHICYDLICDKKEDVILIRNLPQTSYGESDPNVRAYGLQTYFGHVVKCEGNRVGSLCVLYQTDYRPSNDDRRVLGIIASAIGNEDKRRQAEVMLRERETTLKSIFRAAPIGIGLATDRILKEVNERLCEMMGYQRQELIGQSARILYADQDEFERVGREKYAQIRQLATGTVETIWKRKDGALIDVLLSSTPLDPADLIAGVTFTALDITERKRVEDTLRGSEERFKKILDSLDVGVTIIDTDSHQITSINPKALALLRASEDQILGKVCHEYICPAERGKCPISDLGQTVDASERILLTADGGELPILKSVVQTQLGGHDCLVESFIDITDRKTAEEALKKAHDELELRVKQRTGELRTANEQLLIEMAEHKRASEALRETEERIRASLAEKEVLLREIHHRVKNNLQIISSLLSFQAEVSGDEQPARGFKESQNRIQAMALVHERLYQTEDLTRIDMSDYIQDLVSNLLYAYEADLHRVKMKLDTSKLYLGIDTAIPFGLILNELTSNCLKHAFPGGRDGEIAISFHSDAEDKYTLTVSDDGIGLPKGLDIENTESLGLRLVSLLVGQLDGVLEVDNSTGTQFKITFGELKYKPRR